MKLLCHASTLKINHSLWPNNSLSEWRLPGIVERLSANIEQNIYAEPPPHFGPHHLSEGKSFAKNIAKNKPRAKSEWVPQR